MMSIVYMCAKHWCDGNSCQGSIWQCIKLSKKSWSLVSSHRAMLINGGPIRSPQVECDGSINHGSAKVWMLCNSPRVSSPNSFTIFFFCVRAQCLAICDHAVWLCAEILLGSVSTLWATSKKLGISMSPSGCTTFLLWCSVNCHRGVYSVLELSVLMVTRLLSLNVENYTLEPC